MYIFHAYSLLHLDPVEKNGASGLQNCIGKISGSSHEHHCYFFPTLLVKCRFVQVLVDIVTWFFQY